MPIRNPDYYPVILPKFYFYSIGFAFLDHFIDISSSYLNTTHNKIYIERKAKSQVEVPHLRIYMKGITSAKEVKMPVRKINQLLCRFRMTYFPNLEKGLGQ